jgi:hypothetical protein
VRYDGGHKRNARLLEELGRYVRFVPVCPEVGSVSESRARRYAWFAGWASTG